MINTLSQTIEQLSKEKGIDPEIVHRALEDAMVAAARKYFKTEEDLQATFDPETGTIDVFAVREIVEEIEDLGGFLRWMDASVEMELLNAEGALKHEQLERQRFFPHLNARGLFSAIRSREAVSKGSLEVTM